MCVCVVRGQLSDFQVGLKANQEIERKSRISGLSCPDTSPKSAPRFGRPKAQDIRIHRAQLWAVAARHQLAVGQPGDRGLVQVAGDWEAALVALEHTRALGSSSCLCLGPTSTLGVHVAD